MFNRRKFLGSSLLASTGLFLRTKETPAFLAVNKPIVISTWDFGKAANAGAWEILGKQGRALDAVEAGVMIPEADPNNHSVGYGGLPDRDGHVTLDACIMDENSNCGSVMFLEYIVHPISVARMVMEKTPHIVLAGDGALEFALSNGFKKENLLTPESEKIWKEWLQNSKYEPVINVENKKYGSLEKKIIPGGPYNHDTIGMLAMDSKGDLSGACTTSGLAFKMHGRVGDSPIIGAGLYVDGEVASAVATGNGELMMRACSAFHIVEMVRQGIEPGEACERALAKIRKDKSLTDDMQ